MLTLLQLQRIVQEVLGNSDSEPDLSHTLMVNAAGHQLYNMHQWRFAERPPVTLRMVADQSHVDLPEDFGRINAYAMNGLTQDFHWTTAHEIARMRDQAVFPTGFVWWGSLVQPSQVQPNRPLPPPRIEVYPTPKQDTDVLSIWYRSKWVELLDCGDVAALPSWMLPLTIEVVQTFASTLRAQARENLSLQLGIIKRGPIFQAAVDMDGTIQPDYGTLADNTSGHDLGYLPYTAPTLT